MRLAAALAACGLWPAPARAEAGPRAFDATSMDEAWRALGGPPAEGTGIELSVPDVAENGAVVPVSVTSNLPGTQEIALVIERNPYPLIARFTIPEGTEPFISTRVKMAQSGNIFAVVRAGGRLYCTRKDTQVVAGACG
jgi:sulfur-oxidizing protein SoxY